MSRTYRADIFDERNMKDITYKFDTWEGLKQAIWDDLPKELNEPFTVVVYFKD